MAKDAPRNEVEANLRQLDNDLDILRRHYEQYFVGSRERPPTNRRRKVDRLVRDLEQTNISNTSQRFRFRSLKQRYTSLKTKWNRVEREIEQGTYAPHKRKARQRQQQREEEEKKQQESAERQQQEGDEQQEDPRDDVFEVSSDEFSKVDLKSLQQELEQMDQEGEFEKYVPTEKMPKSDLPERKDAPSADAGSSRPSGDSSNQNQAPPDRGDRPKSHRPGGDSKKSVFSGKEQTRKEKLNKLQDKLGLSNRSSAAQDKPPPRQHSADDRAPTKKEKLEKMRQRLRQREQENSRGQGGRGSGDSNVDRSFSGKNADESTQRMGRPGISEDSAPKGASPSKSAGNHDSRQKTDSERRIVDRSSRSRSSHRGGQSDSSSSDSSSSTSDDDDEGRFRSLYRRFRKARRQHDPAAAEISYEQVRTSLESQLDRLRADHDVDDVRFRVVRKDGRVYLQPVLN